MLLNDLRVYVRYLWTGNKPEREDMEVAVMLSNRKRSYETNGTGEMKNIDITISSYGEEQEK